MDTVVAHFGGALSCFGGAPSIRFIISLFHTTFGSLSPQKENVLNMKLPLALVVLLFTSYLLVSCHANEELYQRKLDEPAEPWSIDEFEIDEIPTDRMLAKSKKYGKYVDDCYEGGKGGKGKGGKSKGGKSKGGMGGMMGGRNLVYDTGGGKTKGGKTKGGKSKGGKYKHDTSCAPTSSPAPTGVCDEYEEWVCHEVCE